ncbi:MAG: class I SAM-dependent methyltransferase [Alphaproteobacteria bacterium]
MSDNIMDTQNYLKDHMVRYGSMTLGAFFELCVSDPQYGYYAQKEPFGRRGDFTTAPEISQMFGEMVGAWVFDVWQKMNKPDAFNLVEFGPGRGTLMKDIVRVTTKDEAFKQAVHVTLIDTSPTLRQVQKDALSEYNVNWSTGLSEISAAIPSILIGNEFLDALPIEQLTRNENGWQKRVVKYDETQECFSFGWEDAGVELIELLPTKTQSHQIYEIAPARCEFIKDACAHLSQSGGASLWIDYGYTTRHYGDTLQAVKNHEYSNVLCDVGQSDITAHVDFQALQGVVDEYDTLSTDDTTQGAFLRNVGVEYRALALKNAICKSHDPKKASNKLEKLDKDLERLISIDEMGQLFKVMSIYDRAMTLSGFDSRLNK